MSQDPRRPFDVFDGGCPSREVLEHVTSRWGSLTLAALSPEPARFGELRRCIDGISEKMLSQTLKSLEADGLVDRRVRSTAPLHVDYALTPSGSKVAEAVKALILSLYGVMPDVMAARQSA
ncbi:MAG: transcriptional regulator [Aeromicrobium sp.]|jgi:DNA-binding HxlR family transcriptional regulator|uniref:winged helix-turn-helix transcriptional regulator n=1 Tax=Aeromicrobium sp. TaxID=1871063 RepID=UPI002632092C|nr:helix-turn-helix domain-containing protein [Aeromicrobium sp.]MCW2788312.1 transcriptional regulator [Aeromicrobium sp.]MCW2824228.1 transcriptional regulator [Aeromicrobium sp.]